PNDQTAVTAGDVLHCDFEERADRDYDGWPDGWVRNLSRDLPEFLNIGIIREPAKATAESKTPANATSNHCLEIELNGGGGVISSPPKPVSTQFSLALTARIKTSGLVHDGAWIKLAL